MVRFSKIGSQVAVVCAAVLVARTGAQSITTAVTVSGTPTTTVIAPSPTGRGLCDFHIDHWDCDASQPEATASATQSAAGIEPSPVGQVCELHVDHWHCDSPTATAANAAAEPSPTGQGACHLHGDHWHCENEEAGDSHDGHDHSGHSHAGHSHGGSHAGHNHGPSAEYGCGLAPPEPYDMGLHIAAVFILLAASAFGSFLPILLYSKTGAKKWGVWANEFFFICRHFGTGVILSTVFVHLLSHAIIYWSNECIGELTYEAPAPAIAMAAVWLVWVIDFFLLRSLRNRSGSARTCTHELEDAQETKETSSAGSVEGEERFGGLTYAQAKVAEWDVLAIEAGIIFHSILIGVTLGVATGSGFVALLIAIVFHQTFEGLALGSRLSLLVWRGAGTKLLMATMYVLTTPVGIAIGIGVRETFNGNNSTTLIVIGTLHSVSAGILLYTALVELLSGDFIHNQQMQRASLLRAIAAVTAVTIGAAAMSVLAKWA